MEKKIVTKIWIEGDTLHARTANGETALYNLSSFPGFKDATPSQLAHFELVNGNDIHWPDLDEDINLEGMFYDNGLCPLTPAEDSVVFASR